MTTITGANGSGYVTLTGAETNGSLLFVAAKVASGPKNTLATLYPRNLPIVSSGTLSAGSAGGGTLGTILAFDVTGCFLRTTGGTGGGGTGGANNQARRIISYTIATGAFTVSPNWEVTPDATTTYDLLAPEGVTLGMLRALNPTVAGRTLDVSATGEGGVDWANVGSPTTAVNLSATTIQHANSTVVRSATAASGSATTITLDAGASGTNSIYNGLAVSIISGSGVGQTRIIRAYDGATKIASVEPDWTVAPGGTSVFVIWARGPADVSHIQSEAATDIRTAISGTADSGTTTTMVDAARTEADTDYWRGSILSITSGNLIGQSRLVTAFNPATDTLTVFPAFTQPVGTHTYELLPVGPAFVGAMGNDVITALAIAAGAIDAATFAANAIDAAALAADAVAEIAAAILVTPGNLLATDASGRVTVGALAAAVITATSIASAAFTAAKFATDALDANALAGDAVTEIQSGLATAAALATVAAYVDTEVAAILAAVDTEVAAIKAKTDQMVFTLTNVLDVNMEAINGDPDGATALDRSTRTMVLGTAGAGSTTTSIVTSSLDPAAIAADQFKGRIVIFDKDTVTTALRGQATDITANTSGGVLTVTALTTSPAVGESFVIV